MKRKLALLLLVMIVTVALPAYATEPTQAELDAFQAAMELYKDSQAALVSQGVPTPEELKQEAITAFSDFMTAYPASALCESAQYHIAKCYHELNDHTNAKIEFNKVITDYPTSNMVDDALYMIGFIDYVNGDYAAALTEFDGLITDYEGNTNEELNKKVPYAYFMAGECYRQLNDMTGAHSKWNELIVKYPTHNQAGRAQKRLDQ